MQIGSLVVSSYEITGRLHYGVIVDDDGDKHWLVHWLTGIFTGDREVYHEGDLEVVCK